jgi:hypothetical protein
MRILATIALAAMTFGFASCAKDKPAPATGGGTYDGKTSKHHVHHSHGYQK